MGFTPQDVNRMSVWQYMAAMEGYRQAHDPDAAKELSGSEADELWEWLRAKG
jgi:hypothetical protein